MPSIFTAMHEWEKRRNRIDPPLSRSLPLCLSSSSLIIVVSGQKRAYEWFIWSYHSKVVERVFREYFASIYRQRGRDRDISGEKEERKKEEGGKIQTVFEAGQSVYTRYHVGIYLEIPGIDLTWYYLLLNARVPHRFQFHDRPRSFASWCISTIMETTSV